MQCWSQFYMQILYGSSGASGWGICNVRPVLVTRQFPPDTKVVLKPPCVLVKLLTLYSVVIGSIQSL